MPIDLSKVDSELEKIVDLALGFPRGSIQTEEGRGEVLAAYGSYRALADSAGWLKLTYEQNLRSQADEFIQLRDQIKELKTQARWMKWLAVGTVVLAASSLIGTLIHI